RTFVRSEVSTKPGQVQGDPLGRVPSPLLLRPTLDDLLTAVPDDLAAVERTVEHLPNAARRPAPTAGRCDVLAVQPMRDSEHPDPVRIQLEDAADDCRLRYVDSSSDARGATDILVPVHLAARNLQRLRLTEHPIVG